MMFPLISLVAVIGYDIGFTDSNFDVIIADKGNNVVTITIADNFHTNIITSNIGRRNDIYMGDRRF